MVGWVGKIAPFLPGESRFRWKEVILFSKPAPRGGKGFGGWVGLTRSIHDYHDPVQLVKFKI